MSLFFYLFRNAWTVLWKNPRLWIFGLFLAILGQGGASEVVLQLLSAMQGAQGETRLRDLLMTKEFWQHGGLWRMAQHYLNPSEPVAFATAIVAALAVLVVFLGIVYAMAAVPIATRSFIERKKRGVIGELLLAVRPVFWRVAAVFILSSAAFSVLLELTVFVVRRSEGSGFWQTVGFGALFVVAAILSVAVFFLALYATNAIALKKLSLSLALRDAWRLVTRQWMVSVECGLLFFLLNILAAILIAWFFIPFLWSSLLLSSALAQWGYVVTSRVILLVGVFLVTLIGAAAQTLYATFQTSAWTLLYLQLAKRATSRERLHLLSVVGLPKGEPKAVPKEGTL